MVNLYPIDELLTVRLIQSSKGVERRQVDMVELVQKWRKTKRVSQEEWRYFTQ